MASYYLIEELESTKKYGVNADNGEFYSVVYNKKSDSASTLTYAEENKVKNSEQIERNDLPDPVMKIIEEYNSDNSYNIDEEI